MRRWKMRLSVLTIKNRGNVKCPQQWAWIFSSIHHIKALLGLRDLARFHYLDPMRVMSSVQWTSGLFCEDLMKSQSPYPLNHDEELERPHILASNSEGIHCSRCWMRASGFLSSSLLWRRKHFPDQWQFPGSIVSSLQWRGCVCDGHLASLIKLRAIPIHSPGYAFLSFGPQWQSEQGNTTLHYSSLRQWSHALQFHKK